MSGVGPLEAETGAVLFCQVEDSPELIPFGLFLFRCALGWPRRSPERRECGSSRQ